MNKLSSVIHGLIIVMGLLLALYIFQGRMVYSPPPASFEMQMKAAKDFGFYPWISMDQRSSWGFISGAYKNRGCIVFFHGNAENSLGMLSMALGFDQSEWHMALHEYAGYENVYAFPNRASIMAAAAEATASLAACRPLILVGRSLGSAVASAVAEIIPVDGMILISPFTRMVDVAQHHYPFLFPRLFLMERWDTSYHLSRLKYSSPILFIHGSMDKVVPVHLSRKLYDGYEGPKHYKTLDAYGHNNLPVENRRSALWVEIYGYMDRYFSEKQWADRRFFVPEK